MAWRHKRWAGGDIGVADPFRFHQRRIVLSVWDSVVRSCMLKQSALHDWWIKMTDIYRSLLVNWPSGLPQETSCAVMYARKLSLHKIGCAPAGSGDVEAALG